MDEYYYSRDTKISSKAIQILVANSNLSYKLHKKERKSTTTTTTTD